VKINFYASKRIGPDKKLYSFNSFNAVSLKNYIRSDLVQNHKAKFLSSLSATRLNLDSKDDSVEMLHFQKNCSSALISEHPYVKKYKLTNIYGLREISNNRLAYQTMNSNNECSIKTIDEHGNALSHGKSKDNSYHHIGNKNCASHIFLCIGYASGEAIFKIVSHNHKRLNFCVVICSDIHNLVATYLSLSEKHDLENNKNEKKYLLCPNNEKCQVKLGYNNLEPKLAYELAVKYGLKVYISNGRSWADDFLESNSKTTKRFFETKKLKNCDYLLKALECTSSSDNISNSRKLIMKALNSMFFKYPSEFSSEYILKSVLNAAKKTSISKTEIVTLHSAAEDRIIKQDLKVGTFNIRPNCKNINIIDSISSKDAYKYIQVYKKKYPNKKLICINTLRMGEGKTLDFLEPLFKDAVKSGSALSISADRAMVEMLSKKFSACHYKHAITMNSNNKESFPFLSLAVTIHSVLKPCYRLNVSLVESLFLDEFSKTLNAVSLDTIRAEDKARVIQGLSKIILKSKYVYIADADFGQLEFDYLVTLLSDNNTEIIIFKPKNKISYNSKYVYLNSRDRNLSLALTFENILKHLNAGKRIAAITDSKACATALASHIKKHLGKKFKDKVLLVSADNIKNDIQQNFIRNSYDFFNKDGAKYKVVIFTPAIQSGISINGDHFDKCYGLYYDQVMSNIFRQMIHRIRGQNEFILSSYSIPGEPFLTTNSEKIMHDTLKATVKNIGINRFIKDIIDNVSWDDNCKRQPNSNKMSMLDCSRLVAKIYTRSNIDRNRSINSLLTQAKFYGISIKKIDVFNECIKKKYNLRVLKKKLAKSKIKANEEYNSRISKATREHKATGLYELSNDEQMNYKIAKKLGKSRKNLTPEDVKHFTNGIHIATATLNSYHNGINVAIKNDSNDRASGMLMIDTRHHTTKFEIIDLIVKTLKLNRIDLSGEYNSNDCTKLRTALFKEPYKYYIETHLKLDISNRSRDVLFIHKMVKKLLGLKRSVRQIQKNGEAYRVYYFTKESRDLLMKYYKLKYPKELNFKSSIQEKSVKSEMDIVLWKQFLRHTEKMLSNYNMKQIGIMYKQAILDNIDVPDYNYQCSSYKACLY
jgi:hypothetical protein